MDSETNIITVIIVDDHPMVRDGLRSMLTAPDINVIGEAASGPEAIRKVAEQSPDITLMDIRMGDMDGIATLQAIKAKRETTRLESEESAGILLFRASSFYNLLIAPCARYSFSPYVAACGRRPPVREQRITRWLCRGANASIAPNCGQEQSAGH